MNDPKSLPETRNSAVLADGADGTGRRTFLWFASIPVILCGLGAIALMVRSGDGRALAVDAQASTRLPVDIIHAQLAAAANEIVLPGTLQAYDESPVYARTSGYVRKWYVDIGQRVKAGQLLAEIDAPEVDQQLQHARAVLNQTQASLSLADVTARRYRQLIKLDAVSQQQVDQNEQNLLAQQANVKAASADVANLQQQQAYEKVVAPFDGIVTARHTDIGDLINAGNGGPGAELFRVSRTSTMRTFVSVPEEYSQQIRDGMHVSLELTELPGERFEGSVTRSAGAINVQSRTLLVEVDVLNASERLMPGAYAKVHIGLAQGRQSLRVPAGSILFQTAGPQIAVVDPAQHIELRKVSIGIDYGNSVEITSGITPDDPIVANPPDYVLAGMPVSVRRTVGQPEEPGNGVVHSPK